MSEDDSDHEAGSISRAPSLKEKKISKAHPEFELTYDMMLGIRTTVGQVESKPARDLTPKDYTEKIKLRFPAGGSHSTPAHDMRSFKFKDYCPEVFRNIRKRFAVNPLEYILCVCGNFEYLEFISNSQSGQFFFYTHNQRYMIKTISQKESKFLIRLLPSYFEHICNNPNTLITQFFGLHRVKPHKKRQVHFLIMGSVFFTPRVMHFTYDLKGSRFKRSAKAKEKARGEKCVYKDNDILEMQKKISIGPERARTLNDQIARDTEYLRKRRIMDYSLLLGIHDTTRKNKFHQRPTNTLNSRIDEDISRIGMPSLSLHQHQRAFSTPVRPSKPTIDLPDENAYQHDAYPTTPQLSPRANSFSEEGSTPHGLPKNYDRMSIPAQSSFKAPKFVPLQFQEGLDFEDVDLELERKTGGSDVWETTGGSVTVHSERRGIEESVTVKRGVEEACVNGLVGCDANNEPNHEIYYCGIIDILIKYDSKKRAESVFKSIQHGRSKVSAVSPKYYAKRFRKFMAANVISPPMEVQTNKKSKKGDKKSKKT